MEKSTRAQVIEATELAAPGRSRLAPGLRQLLPLLVGGAMVVLLAQKLAEFDLAQVRDAFSSISPWAWAASLAFSALSFRAVAQYDVIAHRIIGTGLSKGKALASGASATALAQMLGLGLVTGSLVRWRLLRTHGEPFDHPARAMGITGLVSVGFMFGWAVTTLVAFALLPSKGGDIAWIGWTFIPLGLVLCAASLLYPRMSLRGRSFTLPGLPMLAGLVGWAALDTIAAAGALYVLLPSGTDLSFAMLLPAFLLALGCGIVSGTPGGFGAFELTLLALTPAEIAPQVLAAVVGYRLTYYVLPAMLAAGHVLWPADREASLIDQHAETDLRAAHRDVHYASDPLCALLYDGQNTSISTAPDADCGPGHWQVRLGNQALVALGAPFGDPSVDMERALRKAARDAGVPAVVYKAPEATARMLHKRGWIRIPLGAEAVISPADFDIAGPKHRQLRRKLRHAEKADVVVSCPDAPPLPAMETVARRWSLVHGGERGFSMGRFGGKLLRQQRVYVARQKGALIAFVSFHMTQDGWMLDLVRHNEDIPDGTMHTLIHAAINDAAEHNVGKLSLDCVPFHVPDATGAVARLYDFAFQRATGANGLRQFKMSFDPIWESRSLMVRGPGGFFLGGAQIALALAPRRMLDNTSHDYHADYAFDA